MSRVDIILTGSGGQGIIRLGIILGRAASIYDNKYAVQTQSYGPEVRGSISDARIIISDEEIDYPIVLESDILVSFSQEGLNRLAKYMKKNSLLFVDQDLVKNVPEDVEVKVFNVPATRIASETLGKRVVANVVMLGVVASLTGIVSKDALKKAVLDSVPEGAEGINVMALEEGFKLAEGLKPIDL